MIFKKVLYGEIMNLKSFLVLSIALLIAIPVLSQDKKPRVSPKAGVLQIVGLTTIEISYSRPGVKGRNIWGGLVPYSKVWRAGADEATKFTFSTDVMIEGKRLQAGSYSFFVIPEQKGWTLIFNKVADQWGAYEYNEAEDAMRFSVKPVKMSAPQEWLLYEFTDMKSNSATINLKWENLRVPFKVEVKI
jgi:hypothetical protein